MLNEVRRKPEKPRMREGRNGWYCGDDHLLGGKGYIGRTPGEAYFIWHYGGVLWPDGNKPPKLIYIPSR